MDKTINSIPADWQVTALHKLIDEKAPICYGILKPGKHIEDGIPVIKVKDYVRGFLQIENLLRTTSDIDHVYRRSRLKENDLLLSIRGSVGDLIFVPPELEGANITQDTARLRFIDHDKGMFVFHTLKSSLVKRQIRLDTVGQAVQGINIGSVRKLKIPVPPENEMKRITEILSTWDQAIGQTQKLIESKKHLKKGLTQQLLTGRVRFPEFEEPALNSNEIPEGWQLLRAEDIFQNRSKKNCGSEPVLSVTQDQGVYWTP